MSGSYHPGREMVALLGAQVLVVTDSSVADRVVTLVGRDVSALEVVEALSAGTLADLPRLVAALVDGEDLVVVARGDFEVTCGALTIDASEVTTWLERRVTGGADEEVKVRGARALDTTGAELPVVEGVVLAGSVAWRAAPLDAKKRTTDPVSGESEREDLEVVESTIHDAAPGPRSTVVGSVTLPDGEVVTFETTAALGRAPRSPDGAMSVAVEHPLVSSTHVMIEVQDCDLVLTDLSTNGTAISGPSGARRLLVPRSPTPVPGGSTVWLADDVGVVVDLDETVP